MPLPLVELNRSTIAWRAAAFAPVCVCQSVSPTGEPDSSMSAWVFWAAGVAAPLHAVATTMTAAMIATFKRMNAPPSIPSTCSSRRIRMMPSRGYLCGPPPG